MCVCVFLLLKLYLVELLITLLKGLHAVVVNEQLSVAQHSNKARLALAWTASWTLVVEDVA